MTQYCHANAGHGEGFHENVVKKIMRHDFTDQEKKMS